MVASSCLSSFKASGAGWKLLKMEAALSIFEGPHQLGKLGSGGGDLKLFTVEGLIPFLDVGQAPQRNEECWSPGNAGLCAVQHYLSWNGP